MTIPRSWRGAFLRIFVIIGMMLTPLLMTESAYADTLTSGSFADGSTWNASMNSGGNMWVKIWLGGGGTSDNYWYTQYATGSCSVSNNNCWSQAAIRASDSSSNCQYSGLSSLPPPYSQYWTICATSTVNTNYFNGGIISIVHCPTQQPQNPDGTILPITSSACTRPISSTPWCATTDFSDISGSYVGTSLTVRFKWLNATKPTAGWTVIGPDPGSNTGSSGTIPLSATVDGYPGYYSSTISVSSDTAMTARIYTAVQSNNPGCYVSLTLSSNAISVNPNPGQGDTGNDTQTSSNPNCGWSLNPFHYLKCLFEPSSSLQQWSDLQNTAKTHPPISLVVGGVTYISDGIAVWNDTGNSCGTGGALPSCAYVFDGPDNHGHANLIQAACDYMTGCTTDHATGTPWGEVVYYLEEAGIGGFFIWRIWAIIAAAMGTKPVTE